MELLHESVEPLNVSEDKGRLGLFAGTELDSVCHSYIQQLAQPCLGRSFWRKCVEARDCHLERPLYSLPAVSDVPCNTLKLLLQLWEVLGCLDALLGQVSQREFVKQALRL